MAIPSEKDIELPLLQEIQAAGGQAKPTDLYDRVARHFPQLTQADRETKYEKTDQLIWPNRVQWTRNDLVKKGELDASTRGIWKITDRGRARLGVMPSAPAPPRSPLPLTPTPSTIGELLDRERREIRAQLHDLLMNLHPQQFEAFAGKLLESVGFTDVQVTKYVGDGGIDGYGNLEMGVVKVRAAFQVKRWRNNVPPAEVNQFRGAISGEFDQGIFITTSDFSDEAKRISSRRGVVPIVLINGDRIASIMLEKGLGIRQEPLTITRIDEEFFAAFGTTEE
jgi:restriction system protein